MPRGKNIFLVFPSSFWKMNEWKHLNKHTRTHTHKSKWLKLSPSWLHSTEKSLKEEKADRIVHLTCCFSWVHWCLKISVQAGGQRSSRSSVGPCRHWGMRPGPVLFPLPTRLKPWLNSQTQQGIVRQCVQFCHSGTLIQKDYHSLSQLTMVCCYVFLDHCFKYVYKKCSHYRLTTLLLNLH